MTNNMERLITSRYVIEELGTKSDSVTIQQAGTAYKEVGARIREVFADSSFLIHNVCLTVYENENQDYIDLSKTRFKTQFGKIYL